MLSEHEVSALAEETATLIHYSDIDPVSVGQKLLDKFPDIREQLELSLCRIVAEDVRSDIVTSIMRLTDQEDDALLAMKDSETMLRIIDDYTYALSSTYSPDKKMGQCYVAMEMWAGQLRLGHLEELFAKRQWHEAVLKNIPNPALAAVLRGDVRTLEETKMYFLCESPSGLRVITQPAFSVDDTFDAKLADIAQTLTELLDEPVTVKGYEYDKQIFVQGLGIEPSDDIGTLSAPVAQPSIVMEM